MIIYCIISTYTWSKRFRENLDVYVRRYTYCRPTYALEKISENAILKNWIYKTGILQGGKRHLRRKLFRFNNLLPPLLTFQYIYSCENLFYPDDILPLFPTWWAFFRMTNYIFKYIIISRIHFILRTYFNLSRSFSNVAHFSTCK